ncbi:WD repeat-containing protein 47-like [Styela clava]
MQIIIHDSDVVSMILEYLHSRQLYESAIALERETGVFPAADGSMPENLQYLRRLSLDGEWDNVLFYLEPFTELGEFSTDTLNYLVLRQKYIEILHGMSANKTCSAKEKENLIKILKEIQPYCTAEELNQLKALDKSLFNESGSISASRFRCFKNILDVLSPIFDSYGPGAMGGEVGGQWIHQKSSQSDFTRLESVMSDAMLLNECCKYCRHRALSDNNEQYDGGDQSLTSHSLGNIDYDVNSNAGLMFWIKSLRHNELFRQKYEINDIQLKIEPIRRPKSSPSKISESPKKFSSFASPKKQSETRYTSPSVSRSAHLHSSERPQANRNRLASSVPPQHKVSRSFSNNNNNSNNSWVNPENQEIHPQNEDVEIKTEETDTIDPRSSHPVIAFSENIQNEVLENGSEQFTTQHVPVSSVEHEEAQENKLQQPSQVAANVSEKPLRDSSNLPIAAPVQHVNGQLKVDESYDKFLSEKKKQKVEHQQFLEQLKEKEKKNDEIRQILLQQQADNSKKATMEEPQHHTVKPTQPIQRSLKQKSLDSSLLHTDLPKTPPPKKISFVPIEYTEDVQAIRTVEFHPSGQVYAVGSNSKILRICNVPRDLVLNYGSSPRSLKKLEDIKSRTPRSSDVLVKKSEYHRGSIYCMGWNAEGSLLATGSNDKLIKTLGFDILGKTLDETPREMAFHRGIVRELEFLRDSNNILASAGADAMVFIIDCNHKKQIHSLAGHTNNVLSLCSWDQGKLATASQDKTIRLWDVRSPSCVSIFDTSEKESCFPTSVCVDNSGRWVAVGLTNSKVGLYDRTAGKMAIEYKCHNDEVRCVRFNPVFENQLLSSSYDENVVLTNVDQMMSEMDPSYSQERHWSVVAKCKNKIIQCKWHPNGEAFATTSVDKTCRLWLKVIN